MRVHLMKANGAVMISEDGRFSNIPDLSEQIIVPQDPGEEDVNFFRK